MSFTGTVPAPDTQGARSQVPARGRAGPRPRLAARLDRFTELMVVQAPAGMGKTVLLDRWIAARRAHGTPVLQFAVDSLSTAQLTAVDESTVVVVDDLDQPLPPELSEALLDLCGGSRGSRLVLSGRDADEVRRLAWRRGVQVSSLDAVDLAATVPELQQMARSWGHELDTGRVTALHTATAGWPAVSRLLLDAADSETRSFDLDAAVDYLGATVLENLSTSTRMAAEALALIEEISEDHLHAVIARLDDPALGERQLVATMERARLLRRRDAGPGWTMPPVLRHALHVSHYGLSTRDRREWHRCFARSLLERQEENIAQFLRHARAGEDWEALSDIWTRYGMGLLDRCEDAVVTAYRHLPEVVVARWSYLAVPVAVVAWLTQERSYADVHRAFCHSLRPLAAEYLARADEPMELEERLAGASAVIITDRMDGHLDRASEVGDRVAARIGPQIADRTMPMRYPWFLMQRAMTALATADWPRAIQLFSQSFDAAHGIAGAEFIAANGAANAALITAFDGSTEDTAYWLSQYQHFADPTSRNHGHVSKAAHLAEAILALDALDAEATEWHLEAAGDVATDLELWPCNLYVRTQQALHFGDPGGMLSRLDRARATHPAHAGADGAGGRLLARMEVDLLLALGEVNRARVRLGEATPPWLATSRARLHLITGDPERARYWASATVWAPAVTARDRLDRLMIQAVAVEQQGQTERADRVFRQAVALAAQIGTLRGYPLVPRSVGESLLHRSPGALGDTDLERLRTARQTYPTEAPLVALSAREHVVLQQMTRFDNVRRIAQALTVSPNTVKKQMVAVYAKLGVHDRESALLEAHRLGLLPS